MIRGTLDLLNLTLGATDGTIGTVKDVYFDEARWAIRYLIVDTGDWLPGRRVLISPFAVRAIEWGRGRVDVGLTRQQVKYSPDIDTQKPISRQNEEAYLSYYGYPYYWGGSDLWGATAYPIMPPPIAPELRGQGRPSESLEEKTTAREDSHLRSALEVIGYGIEAVDDSIGHVEDLLFDEQSWQVRFLAIATRNWLPGKRVLIPPQWIDEMNWADRTARVHVTRAAIKESPPYDPANPPKADYEANLYRHYGRPLGP